MKARKLRWLAVTLLALGGCLLLAFFGWSREPSVSGTVSVDGEPLLMGSITLIPINGTPGPGGGSAIEEGEWRIEKGLRPGGEYRVKIQGVRPSPKPAFDPLVPALPIPDAEQVVPPEYNEKSKLVMIVNRGSNPPVSFELRGFDNKRARASK
jgi:hypothetical protein